MARISHFGKNFKLEREKYEKMLAFLKAVMYNKSRTLIRQMKGQK